MFISVITAFDLMIAQLFLTCAPETRKVGFDQWQSMARLKRSVSFWIASSSGVVDAAFFL